MNFDDYDSLVHRIYDASLQPDRWPAVLERVAEACQASRALLYTPHHTPDKGGFLFPFNIGQPELDLWARWGHLADPLVKVATDRGLIAGGEGIAMNGEGLVPFDELVRTEFYKRLWEPMDVGRVVSGMVFDGTDAHKLPTILAVYRSARAPAFSESEVSLIRRLLAHVSRSLGVMFHLRDHQLHLASSRAALDRLPGGIFLLSDGARLQFANAAGHRLLAHRDPFIRLTARAPASADRLVLADRLSRWDRAFQACLDAMDGSASGETPPHFSAAIVLPDASGRPAYVVNAAPLGDTPFALPGHAPPHGILIVYDVSTASGLPPAKLVQAFGFTPAEARAAIEMMNGGSASDMAARLGVSLNTFKTQLRAVYGKSHSHRHADLLKLLLALATAH